VEDFTPQKTSLTIKAYAGKKESIEFIQKHKEDKP